MKYTVRIFWEKKWDELFTDNKYSRTHQWNFDGGAEVLASSSPQVVAVPMSDELAVDPEEAFVASLSSCHMLFFLSIAASHNYRIENYEDHAEGLMSKDEHGKMAMTMITLNPKISFSGTTIPSPVQIETMHTMAHQKCYIANSVKSVIHIIRA